MFNERKDTTTCSQIDAPLIRIPLVNVYPIAFVVGKFSVKFEHVLPVQIHYPTVHVPSVQNLIQLGKICEEVYASFINRLVLVVTIIDV